MRFPLEQRLLVTAATLLVSVAIYAPMLSSRPLGRWFGWLLGVSAMGAVLALAYRRATAVARAVPGGAVVLLAYLFYRAARAQERLGQALVAVPALLASWTATSVVWREWDTLTDAEVEDCVQRNGWSAPIACPVELLQREAKDLTSAASTQAAALLPVALYGVLAWRNRARASGKVIAPIR